MRVKTTNWDALAAAKPNDAVAARVTSRSSDTTADDSFVVPAQMFHSPNPPEMWNEDELSGIDLNWFHKFVGMRIGKLTVVGKNLDPPGRRGKARWVVRCDCGTYEHRMAASLRNPGAGFHACLRCSHDHRIKERLEALGPLAVEDFVDGERPGRIFVDPNNDRRIWSKHPFEGCVVYVREDVARREEDERREAGNDG